MPYNRQFMGWTGAASASTIVFPPQAVLRTTDTGNVNNPESPTIIMRATPNPSEIWRLQAGSILRIFLDETGGAQMDTGQIFVGKLLAGGLGTRYYHVVACNMVASKANSIDQNSAQRMQQTMRVHPSETLILSVNDGAGGAWDASDANHEVQIPYTGATGVSPSAMKASLKQWG